MDGSLVFSYFTKTNGAWDFLMAEIKHRNIKRPKTVERGAKNKPKKTVQIKEWTELKEAELVILLKEHEQARLLREEEKKTLQKSDGCLRTGLSSEDVAGGQLEI